ncbi:MAG: phosphonopyruvate decarboxylase [Reyranellaceae bacterium]
MTQPAWPDDIFAALKRWNIGLVAHVPDAGHKRLLELCASDNAMRMAPLATEEDGVALLAGFALGGRRGALLMQSSGVGNCINMLGLPRICRLPLLMLVTMRGEWGEFNPWQVSMGQASEETMKAVGVIVQRVEQAEDVAAAVEAAARLAFEGPNAVALLLGQRLIGSKSFAK